MSDPTPFERAIVQAEAEGRVLAYLICGGTNGGRQCRRRWGAYVRGSDISERLLLTRSGRPSCNHNIDFTGGSIDIEELDALVDGSLEQVRRRVPTYTLRPFVGAPKTVTEVTAAAEARGQITDLQEHPLPSSAALPSQATNRDTPRPT